MEPGQSPATDETNDSGAETQAPIGETMTIVADGAVTAAVDSLLPPPPDTEPLPIPAQPQAPEPMVAPVADHTPTRAEAREMFKGNPGLWSVVTDTGPM